MNSLPRTWVIGIIRKRWSVREARRDLPKPAWTLNEPGPPPGLRRR